MRLVRIQEKLASKVTKLIFLLNRKLFSQIGSDGVRNLEPSYAWAPSSGTNNVPDLE
jgi:hypothetical protein